MQSERVTFTSEGLRIVGDLRVPEASQHSGPKGLPALALTGPLSGVKDQVVGNYADRLAAAGFVTLAFDHRNFGDSEGEPRQHEDSAGKLADIRDAVGYLSSRPEVDADRVGIVGVCLGGGYAVHAAAFDPRVRAVAGVGGSYANPARLRQSLGPDVLRERLTMVVANLEKERAGAEIAYLPTVSTEGIAIMPGQEPFDYYGTERSKSTVWENRMTMDSWYQLMTLDNITAAELLDRTPLLIVHGKVDEFCTPDDAQALYDRATGPKEIEWLESANHIDIYDRPALVDPAVARVAEFMARELSPRETTVERFRRALELRGRTQLQADELVALSGAFAGDVTWAALHGRDAVVEGWQQSCGVARVGEVVYADGTHVVGVLEYSADAGRKVRQAVVFHLDDEGRATEVWALPGEAEIAKALEGEPVSEHPNLTIFRAAEEARARDVFEGENLVPIERFLRDDVTWHSPWGGGPESRDEVIEQFKAFDEMSGGTMRFRLDDVFADDTHAVSLVVLHMERPDKPGSVLDAKEANVFHLDGDGRAFEFWGVAEDQAAINDFWS